MRKLFIALFVSMFFVVSAQEIKPISFSEVITVENKNKKEIYNGLRQWVYSTYNDGKAVTQMEDADAGIIILKAACPYHKGGLYSAYEGYIEYMLKLQIKDGRYKVEMTNFTHENLPGRAADCSLGVITTAEKSGKGGINKAGHNKIWKEIKPECENIFGRVAGSLKEVKDFSGSEEEEDW